MKPRQPTRLPKLTRRHFLLAVGQFVAAACVGKGPESPPNTPGAANQPGQPGQPSPTAVPTSPLAAAREYAAAWEEKRYADMYNLLSTKAQQGITADRFIKRYQDIGDEATIQAVKVLSIKDNPDGKVPIRVQIKTTRVGTIEEDNVLPFSKEQEFWKLDWTPSLIFKDLEGDNLIHLFSQDPVRGNIFDRKGRPLAIQGKSVVIGVVPGKVKNLDAVIEATSRLLKLNPDETRQKIQAAQPDWFVPLREVSPEEAAGLEPQLLDTNKLGGILFDERESRSYPNSTLAAHVLGFLTKATAEDLKEPNRYYSETDLIGRAGVEGWGEGGALTGEKGAKLAVITKAGSIVKVIGQAPFKPAQNVHLSIDIDVQRVAEEALANRTGSVVVLDVRDNSILALASGPTYDPNKFVRGFADDEWQQFNNDPARPLLSRPTQGLYPTGSVFKIITMAAGMERLGLNAGSGFDCNGKWDGLPPQPPRLDWLPQGHGKLDLQHGLTYSCNIVFYELGKRLDQADNNALPGMAKAFGLGAKTGVEGMADADGIVPDPEWKKKTVNDYWATGDAVNLAIGQGFLEATPLQVANYFAAVANGGTLRTPVLVQKLTDSDARETPGSGAKEIRKLPVQPANLAAIQAGMKGAATDLRSPAYGNLRGIRVPIAAKTGSAENEDPNSHAWFGVYAPADTPQIAVVSMLERGGTGSGSASPIGRQIIERLLPG